MFLLLAPGYSSFSVAQYYCCTKASVKNLIVVSPITFLVGKKWLDEGKHVEKKIFPSSSVFRFKNTRTTQNDGGIFIHGETTTVPGESGLGLFWLANVLEDGHRRTSTALHSVEEGWQRWNIESLPNVLARLYFCATAKYGVEEKDSRTASKSRKRASRWLDW